MIDEKDKSESWRKNSAPYGYKRIGSTKQYERDEDEQKIIGIVIDYRNEIGMSYSNIAIQLNRRGHKNRAGNPFIEINIKRIYDGHLARQVDAKLNQ